MKNLRPFIIIIVLLLLMIPFCGCANNPQTKTHGETKPIISVSIPPEKEFVQAVCGDLVEIITIIPPGSSPTNYEPTPLQRENFAISAIYFPIGVPTEAVNILPYVSPQTKVVALAEQVPKVYPDLILDEGRDPHIWLSPKRVMIMVQIIAQEMAQFDPVNSDIYASNAAEYIMQLEKLEQEIKNALKGVENRKIIVFHPSFAYLAHDYGLEMYALEEHGKEATPEHLQEMIDLAKEQKIKVIFYQAEIDSSQSKAFAEEIGGQTVMMQPLAENYIENMGNMAQVISEAME